MVWLEAAAAVFLIVDLMIGTSAETIAVTRLTMVDFKSLVEPCASYGSAPIAASMASCVSIVSRDTLSSSFFCSNEYLLLAWPTLGLLFAFALVALGVFDLLVALSERASAIVNRK